MSAIHSERSASAPANATHQARQPPSGRQIDAVTTRVFSAKLAMLLSYAFAIGFFGPRFYDYVSKSELGESISAVVGTFALVSLLALWENRPDPIYR